jgi:hypothetical protein
MDVADAMIFALLAVADMSLIARFRVLRKRRERAERMSRSLKLVVKRELFAEAVFPQKRHLRRAS